MSNLIQIKDQNDLVKTENFKLGHWKYEFFNPVQSRVSEIYESPNSIIIAASTSAGKTTVAEMYLSHEIKKRKGKGLFLVPLKALAQEKIDQWSDPQHFFNDIKISICTGDYRLDKSRMDELNEADLIIMTSEMLNHKVRNVGNSDNDWLKKVGTIVVDESHLLTVPDRGDHLEIGLINFSRANPEGRFVFLSATMPNVDEIGEWISASLTKKPTYILKSEYRPVPLNVHYEIYDNHHRSYESMELEKIKQAMNIVNSHPEDKFLIFSHTKRTGERMVEMLFNHGIDSEFHNADLSKEKRIELENKFRNNKDFRVVVATSTLAWGCYAEGTNILLANNTIKKIENICVGDCVYSMTNDGFAGKKVLKIAPKNPKYSYKVILSSGEEAVVSPDHKFFGAIDREVPDYNIVSSYKNGDLLAVPNQIDGNNVIADDFGYICGYFCGDGCKTLVGKHANGDDKFVIDIAFGSSELVHLNYMKFLFSKVIGYDFKSERIDSNGIYHLITKKQSVVHNFDFFKSGRNKHSFSLFDLPRQDPQFIKGVLQGLFDSDGGFSYHCKSYVSIEFSTISKNLANEVQQYLLMFGVRASVSKKKIKDTVINGRLQLARRDYIYRVRIYGDQVDNFMKFIGFRMECKSRYGEYVLNNQERKDNKTKNILPVRKLLIDHARANNITAKVLAESVGIDLWCSINKQDLKFETCKKIVEKYPKKSLLTELLSKNIRFSKIKLIEKIQAVKMYDIEVEDTHNYIGNGIVSHNCNLPARRVVILGIERAMQKIEPYNITQMIGRSGRLGIDPQGDAYVLLPRTKFMEYKNYLQTPQLIKSQLLNTFGTKYKTLAFHITSEIWHENIKNYQDLELWFSKSLACFQKMKINHKDLQGTIEFLNKKNIIKVGEDGSYTATKLAMISSNFYFSPFDVADLCLNFYFLCKEKDYEKNDLRIALALGYIDSYKAGVVSKNEEAEMNSFFETIKKLPNNFYSDKSAIKTSYCYYCLLNGKHSNSLAGFTKNLQLDFERVAQVLHSIFKVTKDLKNKKAIITEIEARIRYGVPAHLLSLCNIPNIGKVRAKKLYEHGIKDLAAFKNADIDSIVKIINLKKNIVEEIKKSLN